MEHLPEQPPYRPPSEAGSVLVRVTRGCAWNRCTFCGMYRGHKVTVRSPQEVRRDLAALRAIHPHAESVFLADSDSLIHPRLPEIVADVARIFPEALRITSYVRLSTLGTKSPAWLHAVRAAGLSRLHAGLESGSARILERVRKGITPEKAIAGGQAALAAGFELSVYVLCGLGGEQDWEEHAAESAGVCRAVWPHFVRLRSLVLLPGSDLAEEHQAGRFIPASALTRLRETRRFVAGLIRDPLPIAAQRRPLHLASDHFSNLVWADRKRIYEGVDGKLPDEGGALLADLDHALAIAEAAREVTDPGTLALSGRSFAF
jgi:radical SAM superfamily enzyme YgiQ (UPF0313 family)